MDDNPYRDPNTSDQDGATQTKQCRRSCGVMVLGVVAIVGLLLGSGFLAQRRVNDVARRSGCNSNLIQIGIALRDYAQVYQSLPPAYTTDAAGNRLHSWRTLILPFLSVVPPDWSIDLTKPWDDPVNAELRRIRVPFYQCLSLPSRDTLTNYLAVVTPDSCIRAEESLDFAEVTDGRGQTLLVIEVDAEHAVPWMMPVDADESVFLGLGSETHLPHDGGMLAVFADGRVEFLDAEMPAAQRRALITAAGNDQAAAEGAE